MQLQNLNIIVRWEVEQSILITIGGYDNDSAENYII